MMQALQLFLKWFWYFLFSRHKAGHSIHSPFMYRLIREVLMAGGDDDVFKRIESLRRELLRSKEMLVYNDPGAGSIRFGRRRRVSRIVRYSAVKKKYGRLLTRLVRYFKPAVVIELGTSAGISSLYLAAADEHIPVFSVEGVPALSSVAAKGAKRLGLVNITYITGLFSDHFEKLLEKYPGNTFIFLDGHHEEKATLAYFEMVCRKQDSDTVLVIDDIHWSEGMDRAWHTIQQHPSVKITVDLFFMGIVFFRQELQQEHFVIRF